MWSFKFTKYKKSGLSLSQLFCAILLFIIAAGCTDELTLSDPSSDSYIDDSLVALNLPHAYSISLNPDNTLNSRASGFEDGLESESALATPEPSIGEYYHYLLLYKDSSNPLIFPIDNTWDKIPDLSSIYNNLTLTISKLYKKVVDGELIQGNAIDVQTFANYVAGGEAYVLLNFKLTETGYGASKNEPNYLLANGSTLTGNNTLKKLSNLKKEDLLGLQLKDYKIRATGSISNGGNQIKAVSTDFFTMTNSVYAKNSNKVIDGEIKPENIFATDEEAEENPLITVSVERLASKVQVYFDIQNLKAAKFGVDRDQDIDDVTVDPTTGLPILSLKVERVVMGQNNGITFDEDNGYKINHEPLDIKIKILGYGLSNEEKKSRLFKDINPLLSVRGWSWNDEINHRSYWSRDLNYEVTKAKNNSFYPRMMGYPHQFRLALDTDTVGSLHAGGETGYTDYTNFKEEYEIEDVEGVKYTSYNKLGKIDVTKTIDGLTDVYLNYKSFDDIYKEFQNLDFTVTTVGSSTFYVYSPLYTHENTYYDPGHIGGDWNWRWYREPYATATNLIVLAEIEFDDNPSGSAASSPGEESGIESANSFTREGENSPLEGESGPRTVYLGQNNIFYLQLKNLLNSKLAILNAVMLKGGNAGIQILHGQWDRHTRWDEDDEDQNKDTHLDKVAWNEASKLWYAKVRWQEGSKETKVQTEEVLDENGDPRKDKDGNIIKRVSLEWTHLLKSDGDIENYLELIPAEISGGDGQCLIAPNQTYMGKDYRYYLAPQKLDANGIPMVDDENNEIMDRDQAVEISYNHLVALIHKIIGPVDVFTNGKMYFNFPIPHRLETFGIANATTAWTTLGGFGAVRNNFYPITISAITKMGTPVHDIYQPIVPVMDVKRSYINLGVKLLKSHEIVEDNIPMM